MKPHPPLFWRHAHLDFALRTRTRARRTTFAMLCLFLAALALAVALWPEVREVMFP